MRKTSFLRLFGLVLTAVGFVCVGPVAAITIKIDYSRDTKGFFNASTTDGAAARSALDAAAAFYSDILEDTFSAIEVPTKTYGSKGGEATYFWKWRYLDPQTGLNDAKVNPPTIGEDEYVIFVGARPLPGGTVGLGGPGGYAEGKVHKVGEFTAAEEAEINSIANQFKNASVMRGETSGFARWGGSIAFDSATTWNFDHTTNPGGGQEDFYSVALHEMAHVLGFGIEDDDAKNITSWESLISGTNFTGPNAVAAFGGSVPVGTDDEGGHWNTGVATSPNYEPSGSDLPLMLSSIAPGKRRLLTNLDAAALVDLGWEIDLPGGAVQALTFAGSGSSSGSVSVAALSLGNIPEPTSALLLSMASAWLLVNRRRRF